MVNRDVLKKVSLLYVEDENDTRDILEETLSPHFKTVYVAKNGIEAFEIFEKKRPDIVLTDIKMPLLGGLGLSKKIKELSVDTPIVIMTAYNDKDLLFKALNLGVDKYITKPVNLRVLMDSLIKVSSSFILKNSLDRQREILANANKEIKKRYRRESFFKNTLQVITNINEILLNHQVITEFMPKICKEIVGNSRYKLAYFSYKNQNTKEFETFYYINDRLKSSVLETILNILPNIKKCNFNNLKLDIDFLDINSKNYSLITIPLRSKRDSESFGAMVLLSKKSLKVEEVDMLNTLSGNIASKMSNIWQQNLIKNIQAQKIQNYEETIYSFVDMIDKRDTYTAGHTKRVAIYCELIAKKMGFTKSEIEKLKKAAILHDIGKIATPDSVLLKPGRLNDVEYQLIKEHVQIGFDFLNKIEIYKDLSLIIKYHHERYDGLGYPYGLKKDEIPMLSHIMILADAFDAMTTNRIYKAKKSINSALSEILKCRGAQFHPIVVDNAVEVLSSIDISKSVDQLPKTDIEKKRFAYFFNDPLTDSYNLSFLQISLFENSTYKKYESVYLFLLKGFTKYNKRYGWLLGDNILIDFVKNLKLYSKNSLIFRIHGDDFVLLCPKRDDVDIEKIKTMNLFPDKDTWVDIQCLDIFENSIYNFNSLKEKFFNR